MVVKTVFTDLENNKNIGISKDARNANLRRNNGTKYRVV